MTTVVTSHDWVLELRLFGTFDARVCGQPLPTLRSRKEQWLLALLILRHGRDIPRDDIAARLWPDTEEKQALFYLRKTLSNLRNALGDQAVRVQSPTMRTVRLELEGAFADVIAFDAAIARPADSADREERLREAIDLYRGPLLAGCVEEWAIVEREARVQAYLSALEAVAERALAREDAAGASRDLRLALAVEPYRESAAGALMRALAQSGDLAAMRQVYQDLRQRLHGDLNSRPSPATEALYKRLSTLEATPVLPERCTVVTPSLRHLPVPLTDLIGRDREIVEVDGWLERARLVTLVGPGGVGKTRLSIAVAEAVLPRFGDGVWFVDLAPLTDGAYVPGTVARALGLSLTAGQSAEERLVEELSTRSLLLVLDNCEHLTDACATLAVRLLGACAELKILATSRQALGVTGEQFYSVPSLQLPSAEDLQSRSGPLTLEKDPSWLMDYAGIRLFVQRAVQTKSSFRFDRRNASAVAEVCRHLDGIPLAIELAAARVRALTVDEINGKLDQRFQLLTGGSRAALPRQQTLRALIDWSYELLSAAEKTLLLRLSVFSGGWTLAAAESVCGIELIDGGEVLDLLTGLVDKSLVHVDEHDRTVRYRMLETIGQYAVQKQDDAGGAEILRTRHRAFFLALAEKAEPEMGGPDLVQWVGVLSSEHDNFRAALGNGAEPMAPTAETCFARVRLVGSLARFWWIQGYISEGRARLASALNDARSLIADFPFDPARAVDLTIGGAPLTTWKRAIAKASFNAGNLALRQGDLADTQARYEESLRIYEEINDNRDTVKMLAGLGHLAVQRGEYTDAKPLIERSLAIAREIGDTRGIATALANLGSIASATGDSAAARAYWEESLALNRAQGDRSSIAGTLGNLGIVAEVLGERSRARALHEESLRLFEEIGAKVGIANSQGSLGIIATREGDYATAASLFASSIELLRQVGEKSGVAMGLTRLGFVALRVGEPATAIAHLREGLILHRDAGSIAGIVSALQTISILCAETGDPHRAVVIGAATRVLRETARVPTQPADQSVFEQAIAQAQTALGDGAFTDAEAEGRILTSDQAVAVALGESSK